MKAWTVLFLNKILFFLTYTLAKGERLKMLNQYFANPNKCINYGHTKTINPDSPDFHLHNLYEIYFFIAGNAKYFIEKKVYSLKYGDLFVMNSDEIHKPYFPSGGYYERIVIHFEPWIAQIISAPDFNLLNCFINRPKGDKNKINLNKLQVEELLNLFYEIEKHNESTSGSSKIMKFSCFLELLIYINKAYISQNSAELPYIDEVSHIPAKLAPILDFIEDNLDSNLTLRSLEQRFYINGSYLCRLFMKNIGSSIHEYIICKRLSMARKLLSEGATALDACIRSGFNDYSNFARMFKRRLGMSPAAYRKSKLNSK